LFRHIQVNLTLIVFILIFSFVESYTFAPWIWIKAEKSKKKEKLEIDNKVAFETQRTDLYKTVSLNNNYNAGVVEDWYYKSYVEFLKKYASDSINANKLLGVNNPKKLFFSSEINHADLKSFFLDTDTSSAVIKVVNYNGNSLEVTVLNNTDGYLSFIENWDDKWRALVNEEPKSITKLFGTFKSVFIPKGKSIVRFVFKPY